MPDPLHQTVSASEAAGLYNRSRWTTRFMLHQRFKQRTPMSDTEDSRMSWGKKMQPLLLEQAAADLKLEVIPNLGDVYHRNGMLGCTRDADIIAPDLGPGALETKCVFDYRVWMENWNGGKNPPEDYEIQLQHQMAVGQDGRPYAWGVLGVWVCGEMKYFHRRLATEWIDRHKAEVASFFRDLEADKAPDPLGSAIEIDALKAAYPAVEEKVIDLRDRGDGMTWAQTAREYAWHTEQARFHDSAAQSFRVKLIGFMRDHDTALLPSTIVRRTVASNGATRLKVTKLAEDLPDFNF